MKKRLIYILAALIILSGGFVLGLGYDAIANAQPDNNIDNVADNKKDDISVNVNTAGSDCIVEYITAYEAADESVKTQENLSTNLVGKTEEEIAQYFSEWNLDYFSEEKITLTRTVQGCPEGYALIKVELNEDDLSTGHTYVYEYNTDGETELRNTIDEVPQLLEAAVLKELMEGKIFNSLDEAYSYLENILE